MEKYQDSVLDRRGNALANASVTVATAAGGAATLYEDDEATVKAQPLTTDASGVFRFKAANGAYVLTITKEGVTATKPVELFDPDDALGTAATLDATAFAATLLDDETAAAARATLGADQASNVHYTLPLAAAIERSVAAKIGEFVSVDDFGAAGDWDGTTGTDDTAAVQAALAAMTARSALLFTPGKRYLVSSNLTKDSTDHLALIGIGAQIFENGASLTGVFSFTSCDFLTIEGFDFEATEDNTYFQANTPSQERAFVVLTSCEKPTLRNIKGRAKRTLAILSECPGAVADTYHFTGFFPTVASGVASSPNLHFAVIFKGCDFASATKGRAEYCSGAFLSQNTSEHLAVSDLKGQELHDSGVYVSSAKYLSVALCNFKNVAESGILARVLSCTIGLNTVDNADSYGIHVTGVFQSVGDAWGAGGNNIVVNANSLTGCGFSIRVDSAYGFYPRDIIVTSNACENSTSTGFFGDIEIWGDTQSGVICSLNRVKTTAADMAINIDGDVAGVGNKLTSVAAHGNVISDVNGTAAASRGGLRLVDVNNLAVSGNVFEDIASGIGVRLLRCDGGSVTGNVYEGGAVVYAPTGESNVDVAFSANRGSTMTVDGANNMVLQNAATVTGYPATSTTPKAIGLMTFSGGAGYVSTGTSSSADWKQITP